MSKSLDSELISIIMPCFNAVAHLPKSVGSILAQTYSNWELITVDDGSSDGTLAWLESQADQRIRVISQPNRGVSSARNAGLAEAKGHFVAFLDADDTWASCFLERMVGAFEADPSIGLAYCGWQNVGLLGGRGAPYIPENHEVLDKKAILLASNRWPIHGCLTTRKLIASAGGFDPRFAVGEDYLLWLEIASFHKICLVSEVLAYYTHHDGEQATRDQVREAKQVREVQEVFLQKHPEIKMEIGRKRIRELTDGRLLSRGYETFWQNDLETAQPIFRMAFFAGNWKVADLKYLIPALLPSAFFQWLISTYNHLRERT